MSYQKQYIFCKFEATKYLSMKKLITLLLSAYLLLNNIQGQSTLELSFSAIDNLDYVQLDSVKVMNRTRGGDTILYWPDTVLVLDYFYVGISEKSENNQSFQLFQNFPNPVVEQTTISLNLREKNNVKILVTDIHGRQILNFEKMLAAGVHDFIFKPGNAEMYFFTVNCDKTSNTIKILNSVTGKNSRCSLDYKSVVAETKSNKNSKLRGNFSFYGGDKLFYIGYTNILQSGLVDAPDTSAVFVFQFAFNIPCPGTPTVTYEGQVYNTIQIFSQCWLKENLNVGTRIWSGTEMTNNNIVEKYCYDNEPDSCIKYGGLYQWNEMMQYTYQEEGVQGICPDGWHLSSDEEWKILEGSVDSQFGIGDPDWDFHTGDGRGYDAGLVLKSTTDWETNPGTDAYGFTGLPGGNCYWDSEGFGGFYSVRQAGRWWTTELDEGSILQSVSRYFSRLSNQSNLYETNWGQSGNSVRCIKD